MKTTILAILLLLISIVAAWLFSDVKGVYDTVEITGVSLEGIQSYMDLKNCIRMKAREIGNQRMHLTAQGRSVTVTSDVIGAKVDIDAVAASAWIVGRELNYIDRIQSRISKKRIIIPLYMKVDSLKLIKACNLLNTKPLDASIARIGDSWQISDEVPGVVILEKLATRRVEDTLTSGRMTVELPSQISQPKIIASDLEENTRHRLALVSLKIISKNTGSRLNIRRGAQLIGTTMLTPGDSFSLSKHIGPRNAANGFVTGMILENGKPNKGMGGGICQCSTIVFQACATSGLTIIKRYPHSRVPSFTPAGTDAMLNADRGIDLVIRNDKPYPVVLSVYIKENSIHAETYAQSPEEESYRLVTNSHKDASHLLVTTYLESSKAKKVLFTSRYAIR